MESARLQIDLGTARFSDYKVGLLFFLTNDGYARLAISAENELCEKESIILFDGVGYRELKRLLSETEQVVRTLRTSGTIFPKAICHSMELQIAVGVARPASGSESIKFTLIARSSGQAELMLVFADADDGMTIVRIADSEYKLLKQIVNETDEILENLFSSGQMKRRFIE